jgi:hypothetical protein
MGKSIKMGVINRMKTSNTGLQAGFVDLKALVDIGRQLNPTCTGLIDRR